MGQLNVGAVVVLEDGAIFSWKSNSTQTGQALAGDLSVRYFLHGRPGPTTRIEHADFTGPDAFQQARRWRRQWPIHPKQAGFSPHEDPDAVRP